jgi:hypothetical protein
MCVAFFRHLAVTQWSGNCGLTLNIWQRVIKEDTKEALFTQLLRRYPVSEQYASESALENIKWFESNKGGSFLLTLIWRIFLVISIRLDIL